MAEAHQAVAFSFAISHEGVHINYDTEVLNIVWLSGVRSYKKRFFGFLNNFKNGVFPSSIEFFLTIVLLVSTLHLIFGIDTSLGIVHFLENYLVSPLSFHLSRRHPNGVEFLSILLWGVILFVMKALTMRYFLKILLMYKGWMYQNRRKASLITKIWYPLMKLFMMKKPQLYSYQASLPGLPVPSIHDTVRRYLRSIKPICKTDEEYESIVRLANEFENGIAKKLQRYLVLKSWWATNYVSDWWEEFVYLRGRQPLMINSNFYGIDILKVESTTRPASRAANLTYASLLFRRAIDRQDLKPGIIQGLVPLCSWQYERVFNTTRIPSIETDKPFHLADSQHVVVISKGKYYKLEIYYKGKLLSPRQLEQSYEKIVKDEAPCLESEQLLGSLTASERAKWAKVRMEYFGKGINRQSLDAIERAAFVVVLEDEPFEYDEKDPTKLDRYGQAMLHGKGCDRWYDKSFNLIIGSNGRAGFNAEHSMFDAPVIGMLWEFILATEHQQLKYNPDGTCAYGELNGTLPAPARLRWDFSSELQHIISDCYKSAQLLVEDVDLKLVGFNTYGKGFMKKCKVSPDAYLQLALQLAYFRDSNKTFCLTYEASMTRLYREGRTETVRPVTIESAKWVRAFEESDISNADKIALFRAACDQHQKGYQDAMCGKGIDRHLFCLYVVSKYLELESPFLKTVLSEPWKLSTSQTPMGQSGLIDLREHPEFISAGGGFGPVADDGYGVSYIIAGEDYVFFHISSKRSSKATDSAGFGRQISRALIDIRSMFEKN